MQVHSAKYILNVQLPGCDL